MIDWHSTRLNEDGRWIRYKPRAQFLILLSSGP